MTTPIRPPASRPAVRARIAPERGRSPWVYVGIGCAAVALIGVLVIVMLAWWGYRKVNRFAEDLKDPVMRAAKVREVLGYETLPGGYHPGVAVSVPLLMDLAILADRELGPGRERLVRSGFVYVHVLSDEAGRSELRDYMAGRGSRPRVLSESKVGVDTAEVLDRGRMALGPMQVSYTAQRGSVAYSGIRQRGLQSISLLECPGDTRLRIGVWFTPDPGVGGDLSGTAADPEALRAFLGHFRLCRSR